jgi:hypothetical protein
MVFPAEIAGSGSDGQVFTLLGSSGKALSGINAKSMPIPPRPGMWPW